MRFPMTALFCAAALVALPTASAFAAVGRPSVCAKEAETELGKLMGQMGKHFKALKNEVGDADKKDSSAAHFTAIAGLAEKCKAHVPATAATDEDKKLYAEQMDKVVAEAKAGAAASSDGKTDDAKKAFGELKKAMSAGHKKFKKED